MKPKTIILMVVAVVCGLGASYLTSRLLAERNSSSAQQKNVSVLVAKKDLDIGISVKEKSAKSLFEFKEFKEGNQPPGSLTSLDQVYDKFLKRNIAKGNFVTASDMVDSFDSLQLPNGKRAVGIRITSENSAAGFATPPGSRVDVLWFLRRGTDDETQCRTLLQDVLVLAADQSSQRPEKGAMPASVVVVALTQEESQKVTLAERMGELKLVLRRSDDKKSGDMQVTSLSDLLNGKKADEVNDGQPSVAPQPVQPNGGAKQPAPPQFGAHNVEITIGDVTREKRYLQDKDGKIVGVGASGGFLTGGTPAPLGGGQVEPQNDGPQPPNVENQPANPNNSAGDGSKGEN